MKLLVKLNHIISLTVRACVFFSGSDFKIKMIYILSVLALERLKLAKIRIFSDVERITEYGKKLTAHKKHTHTAILNYMRTAQRTKVIIFCCFLVVSL